MGFFSSIAEFFSGIPVDEDSQNTINEVDEIVQDINDNNESNLTGQGSEAPISDIAPLEEIEEIDYDYGDLEEMEEDDTPIENPQDNISTSNPEPLACEVKIKDAFFAKKSNKKVPSTEVGSYKFGNPHTVNKDNTTGRAGVVSDILEYIVKPLGEKYNNATTKTNIESTLPYEKLGKNVPFTFSIYDSETQTSSSHNAIIKNSNGKYDGRKNIETKDMEAVAKVIMKNVIPPSDGNSYTTTKEDVKKALTKKEYARDEVVENIKLYRKIDTYTKITKANLGSKVYLVARTENFRNGESVKFKIFESGDKLLSDYVNENEELPFLLGTNERTEVTGVVVTDDIDNPETGNIKEGVVAIEVALRPKKDKPTDENDTDANLEDWKKKFKKAESDTEDKEDKLYLKVSTTNYPDIEEEEFLVGEELVVKNAGCKIVKVLCTRSGKRRKADGTVYYLNYGPVVWGSKPLKDYSKWTELVTDNKITEEEKQILIGMSVTEGKMDSLNCYDSEAITMGAKQNTVNSSGTGQLADLFQDYKSKYPNKFDEILGACGWSVIDSKVFYKDPDSGNTITGKKLKALLRKGCNSSKVFKKIENKHLGALLKLSTDEDFLDLQVLEFIEYYRKIMNKTIYGYKMNKYVKSKLAKATVLDQYVNRPGYTVNDFKKSLDRFLNSNPSVDKNPTLWGVNHSAYETTIIEDYGKKRRGTDMKDRYKKLKKAFK